MFVERSEYVLILSAIRSTAEQIYVWSCLQNIRCNACFPHSSRELTTC